MYPRFIFAFLLLGLSSWICSLSFWERAGERAQYAAVTPHPNPLPEGEGTCFTSAVLARIWQTPAMA